MVQMCKIQVFIAYNFTHASSTCTLCVKRVQLYTYFNHTDTIPEYHQLDYLEHYGKSHTFGSFR